MQIGQPGSSFRVSLRPESDLPSRTPQWCGDIGIGHWVDVLLGRQQPLVRSLRIRPLLGHEPGDVLDVEEPLLGVLAEDAAPEPQLNRPTLQRVARRPMVGVPLEPDVRVGNGPLPSLLARLSLWGEG